MEAATTCARLLITLPTLLVVPMLFEDSESQIDVPSWIGTEIGIRILNGLDFI